MNRVQYPTRRRRRRRVNAEFEAPDYLLSAYSNVEQPAAERSGEPLAPVSTELVVEPRIEVVQSEPLPLSAQQAVFDGARRVMQNFLLRHKGTTLRGYRSDLAIFAEYVGLAPVAAERTANESTAAATVGVAAILGLGRFAANEKIGAWKASMEKRGLEARTINRRLAAVNSMLTLGRQIGVVDWSLDIKGLRVKRISNRKGPTADKIARLLAQLELDGDDEAVRDIAIIRLLRLGLRRGEISSRDLEHLHLDSSTLTIRGKKRHEDEDVTVPPDTLGWLRKWIEIRGTDPGALFVRMHTGERMTGMDIWRMTRGRGRQCFGETAERLAPVRPHGLRHNATVRGLDLTNGNVAAVGSFTRHADIRIVQDYDDERQNRGGKVAELLDVDLSKRIEAFKEKMR